MFFKALGYQWFNNENSDGHTEKERRKDERDDYDKLKRQREVSFSMLPISPTFYDQLLRQNPFAKKLQTQIVSTCKLRKNFCVKKLLVKYW